MRKQHHAIPPALRHNGQLISSADRSRRPNALKHGIFSDAVVIPGEDSAEYKLLIAELMDEYKPAGPTLRNEVIELADLVWKRRRFKKFIQTKLIGGMFNPRCAGFNEAWGLAAFTFFLRTEPETCFAQTASAYPKPDKINYLKQKFPRSSYESTSEWAEAVRNEIFSVLIPDISQFDSAGRGEQADGMMEALRQWKDDCQVAATIMQANELLEYELKHGETLDARITRKIKFCYELKAMEDLLSKK
jgi:hypothetical protein